MNFLGPDSGLDSALLKHSGSDLHEAGDIGSLHIIYRAVSLRTVLDTSLVDGIHDEMEFLVDLLAAPADMRSVLSHLKA